MTTILTIAFWKGTVFGTFLAVILLAFVIRKNAWVARLLVGSANKLAELRDVVKNREE